MESIINGEKIVIEDFREKEWYKKHLDKKRQEYQECNKIKIQCECGSIIIPFYYSKHIKTQSHIKEMKNKYSND